MIMVWFVRIRRMDFAMKNQVALVYLMRGPQVGSLPMCVSIVSINCESLKDGARCCHEKLKDGGYQNVESMFLMKV